MKLFVDRTRFLLVGFFTRVSDHCFDEQFRDFAYVALVMFSSFHSASSQ